MISLDKKYRTRDGGLVRLYATDGAGEHVHGAVFIEGGWRLGKWSPSGLFIRPDGATCPSLDLVEAKTKQEGWIVVLGSGPESEACVFGRSVTSFPYATKEAAERHSAIYDGLAVIRIEWEE